jgi:hypothetical protein
VVVVKAALLVHRKQVLVAQQTQVAVAAPALRQQVVMVVPE